MIVNTNKNSIQLIGNNGSVPEEFSKSFKLFFSENGNAEFEQTEHGISQKESGSIPITQMNKLFSKAKYLSTIHVPQINVGGPQKEIILNTTDKVKTINITDSDPEALDFYNQCLLFYDASLLQRLAGIL